MANTKRRTMRITDKDWQLLKHYAALSDCTVSEYINFVLAKHIRETHGAEWTGVKPPGHPKNVNDP